MSLKSECKATLAWLSNGLNQLERTVDHPKASDVKLFDWSPDMTSNVDKLYSAVVSGDTKAARAVCKLLKDKNELHSTVLTVVKRIETAWQNDCLAVQDVANAFWTTRRALDGSLDNMAFAKLGVSGKAAIIVREGEEHSFGAQLLADQLERSNWAVSLHLDADDDRVLRAVADQDLGVLGFSIGCDQNLLGLADVIAESRIKSCNPHLKVMVGGSAFDNYLDQYCFLGADAVCNDSHSALAYFEQFSRSSSVAGGIGYA